MDANEWLESNDPEQLLDTLRDRTTLDLLETYVEHCLRQFGANTIADYYHRYCNQGLEQDELLVLHARLLVDAPQTIGGSFSLGHRPVRIPRYAQYAQAGLGAFHANTWESANLVTKATRHELQREQCAWLKCLFPRQECEVALPWRTTTVMSIVSSFRQQPNDEHLPILGDALLDAGCENDDIVLHCQHRQTHLSQCWVIELLQEQE